MDETGLRIDTIGVDVRVTHEPTGWSSGWISHTPSPYKNRRYAVQAWHNSNLRRTWLSCMDIGNRLYHKHNYGIEHGEPVNEKYEN